MSSQILYDVDERIQAIKNSLKKISQNYEGSPDENSLEKSKKQEVSFSLNLSSPKSSKKTIKNAFVSNYVAFGNTEESDSSVEDPATSKKLNFDPASSTWYNKSLDLNKEAKNMEGKTNEIIEFELLLNYEKNKSLNLELELKEKNKEIEDLTEKNFKLSEALSFKDSEKQDFVELIERLKTENFSLNSHVEKYSKIVKELEEVQQRKTENFDKKSLYEQQIEEIHKECAELQQLLISKEAEIHYLQNNNRELTRQNNHLEKFVAKHREKSKAVSEKKYQEEIKQLKQMNEGLKDELKKKPAEAAIKETEKKLRDLEKMVEDYCGKKNKPLSTNKVQYRKIIGSLLSLLKLSKFSEIVPKVQEMTKSQSSSGFNFSKKLRNLIIKYSPPGTFSKLPGDKKIYFWIKRLIDEYLMKLKEQEYYSRHLEAMTTSMKLLNITFPEDFVGKITNLLNKHNI